MNRGFEIEVDDQATAWIEAKPAGGTRAILYDVRWCCGGGKMCRVTVGSLPPDDRTAGFVSTSLPDGTELLIDPRAAKRLPARFRLTVRGVGPFRHLDLALTGEEWGTLLYT